ncbi:hypothetical protein FM038_25370 [Shewanella eurypsychrophilus]|uniref:Uncharacterized protein n=1 Tax=Shewanella eurypsychrophilus TaxID=2593656 RepID=A0ABX8S4B5_9GAMM|nr:MULTISPECIES: hypothetical protein [Shewanella]QXP44995.1 hypothetical protein FM038_25370 [Shewanella eurypsychrophilus]
MKKISGFFLLMGMSTLPFFFTYLDAYLILDIDLLKSREITKHNNNFKQR